MTQTSTTSGATSTRPTLVAVCLALATVVSAVASLNVALPSLARETGADHTELAWVVDAYALVFAALLLPAGALGDRYGRRRVLIAGLAVFALAGASATMSDDIAWLIAMRAVLGVGAALVMPATLSTITSTFSEEDRPRAVGAWAGIAGASAILGLLASGTILEFWSWRGVFWFSAGLAVASLVLVVRAVPETRDPEAPAVDKIGALLSAAGFGAVVYAVIEAPLHGWGSAPTLLGLTVGGTLVVGFVGWELRTTNPLIDPRIFRQPRLSAGALTICTQFFAFFGFIFVMLQYLQIVQGHSPLEAAVRMLPLALGLLPAARVLAPRLAQHLDGVLVSAAGLVLAAAALAVLAGLERESSYWLISGGLVALGLGMGLAMTPATSAITDALPIHQQGVGSALNDLARELGGALGIAVLSSLLLARYRDGVGGLALPAEQTELVEQSPALAARLGPEVAREAEVAFLAGMQWSLVAASIALLAAAAAVAALPRGRAGHECTTSGTS